MHPHELVLPFLRFESWTIFSLPQSHLHSHRVSRRGFRLALAKHETTTKRPKRLPEMSLNIGMIEPGQLMGTKHNTMKERQLVSSRRESWMLT